MIRNLTQTVNILFMIYDCFAEKLLRDNLGLFELLIC